MTLIPSVAFAQFTLPKVIVEDQKYIDDTFEKVGEIHDDLRFQIPKVLWNALPTEYKNENFENYDEFAFSGFDFEGAYLNEDKSLVLIRYQYGAIENVFIVLNENGEVIDQVNFVERTRPAYLVDVVGDKTKEIIIPVVEGMMLSTYPITWHIYEVRDQKLVEIAKVRKSFSKGAKYEDFFVCNSITFPQHEQMRVETVLMKGEGLAFVPDWMKTLRLGDVTDFQYRSGKLSEVSFTRGSEYEVDTTNSNLDEDQGDSAFFFYTPF